MIGSVKSTCLSLVKYLRLDITSGSKGWLGGDKIQATMVFESLKLGKR